jgi:hypothetical protein
MCSSVKNLDLPVVDRQNGAVEIGGLLSAVKAWDYATAPIFVEIAVDRGERTKDDA